MIMHELSVYSFAAVHYTSGSTDINTLQALWALSSKVFSAHLNILSTVLVHPITLKDMNNPECAYRYCYILYYIIQIYDPSQIPRLILLLILLYIYIILTFLSSPYIIIPSVIAVIFILQMLYLKI